MPKPKQPIDVPEAIRFLKRAVREKGRGYRDPRSLSVRTGSACIYGDVRAAPACIVGHVIHYAEPKVRLRALNRRGGVRSVFDGEGFGSKVFSLSVELPNQPELAVTSQAREILSRAQAIQDSGKTWGAALDAALLAAEDMGYDVMTPDDRERLYGSPLATLEA